MKAKIYILITIFLSVILGVFWCMKSDKNSVKEYTQRIETKETVKSDSVSVFESFAKDFNSHQSAKINKYIDQKLGVALFYHDGPYPILQVAASIDQKIAWFNSDIFENIEFEELPDYLGDFRFAKTGFFVTENRGKFSLKDFDDSYTSHPESFFDDNKNLETLCNYSAIAIDNKQQILYNFYFNLNKGKLTLLCMSVDSVDDIMFGNPSIPFIPFDSKADIENYFKDHKIFKDKENNAVIDFNKKEITYYDFPNDNPFVFEDYKIGEIKNESDKIKSVEIIFYTDKSNPDSSFITYFSNKGSFVVPSMGVRPPYLYEVMN
ncbi:hypothetical protein [Chryseobacterium sp.]|uniref:hypothetical protein n=1 Tax=Chryseobacterium sp. TaxID=1871047 RepID=UPI0028986956|nr:hypothetical protein [Chryseobacterium sp.]